jgi:two-component system KDP operon response regulator KdpE
LNGKTVLVIEDELQMRKLVGTIFEKEGAKVISAGTAEEGMELFRVQTPHLVVLDIMLPGDDGLEVCRQIREVSDIPIILLTALSQGEEIVRGLDVGADDYITKPFDRQVLLARARAVIRRASMQSRPPENLVFDDGYLMVDLRSRQITVDGAPMRLSATEYDLLRYLLRNHGRVCAFPEILENVWGKEYRFSDEYVHVYVWHLRRKLERDPKNPTYLISEHSVGYRFGGDFGTEGDQGSE